MLLKCVPKPLFRPFISSLLRHISIWTPFKRQPTRNEALEYKQLLYPNSPDDPGSLTRLWDGIKRLVGTGSDDPQAEAERYFQYSVQRLMANPGKFTLQLFSTYLEELCTKLRLIGKGALSQDDVTGPLLQLKNQYLMTKAFTPTELASNSSSIFSHEAKVLIAEYAKVPVKDVDAMLVHYDVCKLDRTWYFNRLALGRPLPTSHEERVHLSYQRPIGRMVQQLFPKVDSMEVEQVKRKHQDSHYKKIPSKTWPWYRHPTSGKSHWRTRPYTKRVHQH